MCLFTLYIPYYSSKPTSSETIPKPFIRGAMHKYSTESGIYFCCFLKYAYMIDDKFCNTICVNVYLALYINAMNVIISHLYLYYVVDVIAWWNHAVVGNYVSRYYVFAIQTIRDLQNRLFITAKAGVHTIESQIESSLLSGYLERREIVKKLTDFSNEQGNL